MKGVKWLPFLFSTSEKLLNLEQLNYVLDHSRSTWVRLIAS